MAANINRVVLVGNLTRDPEMKHLPSGTALCSLRIAVNTPHARTGRASGRTSRTTSTCRCGAPGRELCAVPRQGAPGRDRRPARVASSGRRPTAPASARRSRSSPTDVQFLGSRGDGDGGGGGGGSFVPAGAAQQGGADFPSSPTDDDIPF